MAVDNYWLMKYRSQAGEDQQQEEPPAYELQFQTRANVSLVWPGGQTPPVQRAGMIRSIDRVEVLGASLTSAGFDIQLRVLAWHDEPQPAEEWRQAEEAVEALPTWIKPGAEVSWRVPGWSALPPTWGHGTVGEVRYWQDGWKVNVATDRHAAWISLKNLRPGWLDGDPD